MYTETLEILTPGLMVALWFYSLKAEEEEDLKPVCGWTTKLNFCFELLSYYLCHVCVVSTKVFGQKRPEMRHPMSQKC